MDAIARLELTKATDKAISKAHSLLLEASKYEHLVSTVAQLAQAAALVAVAEALKELARTR